MVMVEEAAGVRTTTLGAVTREFQPDECQAVFGAGLTQFWHSSTVPIGTTAKNPEKIGDFGPAGKQTERAGFEPAVRFYPYAALAKRCFRPLSHLSPITSTS